MTTARSGDDRDAGDGVPFSGRYALGAVIGRGSSAVVHRALDVLTGEPVAVKLFPRGASALDEQRRRRELAALAAVDHPGLVRLRAAGAAEERPYVVMDLVEGPTLAQRLLSGPLSAHEVRTLGMRLAEALAHVHALGLVHRDVKPANVLLGDGDRPRLADFGIVRGVDDTTATGTGAVVGTAAFLAPEQVRGRPVDARADVYALGLVLLEALTGRREYPGAAVESATARLHRSPRVPATALGAVIAAMTAAEPADRPDAGGAAAALAAATDPDAAATVDHAPPRPARTRGRRLRRLAVPVAVSVLLGGALAGAMAVGARPGAAPPASRGGVVAAPAASDAFRPPASRDRPVPTADHRALSGAADGDAGGGPGGEPPAGGGGGGAQEPAAGPPGGAPPAAVAAPPGGTGSTAGSAGGGTAGGADDPAPDDPTPTAAPDPAGDGEESDGGGDQGKDKKKKDKKGKGKKDR